MNIIHRTDLSKDVHENYHVSESVSIIEEFNIYTIFCVHKIDCEPYFKDVYLKGCATDLNQAKILYARAGGIWEE